ncbi:hypothetical protein EVA_16755 [gut metagenome]|uniref:Uncharacterized protein n=1 Tax=gut metagenome TaxID=749906 RepID=J9G6M4_9ZZZZ
MFLIALVFLNQLCLMSINKFSKKLRERFFPMRNAPLFCCFEAL